MEGNQIMTAPLVPPRYPEERRLATVLFADVHGFTMLAEQLDFETVSDLIKDIWRRLDEVIQAHGGYIDKHIGDAVMAVWGAPFAGDNDAEHAVSAALALLASLDEYVHNSPVPGAHKLKLRVGINSGPVFAGYVGLREEYTMIGDTVNVADRLEQLAKPGKVVIGENTFRLVRGAFRVRRLSPMNVKGKTEPVQAFIVEGHLASPTRVRYGSTESMETCMVARDLEMERLCSFYEQSLHADNPLLVLVNGEAGLGKSRLLMEFTSKMEMEEPNLAVLSTRALSQTARVPFYLWKSLLHTRFGLRDNDQPEVAREKFMRELLKLWAGQLGPVSVIEVAHLVGSLIGLEWPGSQYLAAYEQTPEARLERAFGLTRELFQHVCALCTTILLLDDLQWADKGSLDLLVYLLQPASTPLSLLILAGVRPEFLRQQPRWTNFAQVITLSPLPVSAETVAAAYPGLRSLPGPILAELSTRAEGNPYFLEEMVKGLVKSDLRDGEQSHEELLARLHTQMPESLRATLQARLDSISREARAVALLASVVGRVFWVGAIMAAARTMSGRCTGLLSEMPTLVVDRVIQDGLRQLVRAELAFPRAGSQFSTEQEYIFKNTFLRDVAYSLIPHKHRVQCHHAVANWLTERNDVDFKVMAAEHYEEAGVLFEAALQYERAARIAQSRGAAIEADTMLARAKTLHEKIGQVEGSMLQVTS
jgi:class 3 adenylate cyclase